MKKAGLEAGVSLPGGRKGGDTRKGKLNRKKKRLDSGMRWQGETPLQKKKRREDWKPANNSTRFSSGRGERRGRRPQRGLRIRGKKESSRKYQKKAGSYKAEKEEKDRTQLGAFFEQAGGKEETQWFPGLGNP